MALSLRRFVLLLAVAALVLGVSGVPATAGADPRGLQAAERELEAARGRAADVQARLDRVVAAQQAAEAREAVADDALAAAERRVADGTARVTSLRAELAQRARALYTSGVGDEELLAVLTSEHASDVTERLELLAVVGRVGDQSLLDARVARAALDRDRADAADQRTQLTAARADIGRRNGEVRALLAQADAALGDAASRVAAERQRVAVEQARLDGEQPARDAAARTVATAGGQARGAQTVPLPRSGGILSAPGNVEISGEFSCLVGPTHSFSDTYGAPRSGGRRHEGVDVFAPYGSPVFAVESGTVSRAYSNQLGGLAIFLRGNSGTSYYYAHQSANLVTSGQRVAAGEQIGRVGTSGNAAGSPSHVHFEVHPGGRATIDPTPFARRVCG